MDLSKLVAPDTTFPAAWDAGAAEVGLERWLDAARAQEASVEAEAFAGSETGTALLAALFGNSPFLTQLAIKDPAYLISLAESGYDAAFDDALARLRALPPGAPYAEVQKSLRVVKGRVALIAAIADIAGAWPLERVTEALSDLAEAALDACVAHVIQSLIEGGKIAPETGSQGLRGCGYVMIGMGKLGARELNYSSDIDVIALYEPERLKPSNPDRLRQDLVRATQTVVNLMQERTGDGYVFRTDLRLRPDPGMTPLAMPVAAAESYYESVGQNWERAAMIKARPVAGDREIGHGFLRHIKPFVWRKHLDFAAVADIHSIKRQINAHRGSRHIAIEGHNIKLGRGGIREIEFFAQTQQLIWGGRTPALRQRRTLDSLATLADERHTTPQASSELAESYRFLRRLEHRLQMVRDEQTQKMPTSAEGVDAIGTFMGFAEREDFRAALLLHLRRVEGHYAKLFEDAPDLGGGKALVFTGAEDDPETVETLAEMGFETPSHVIGRIRVWHHGRYRSTRSERARQLLTELMPRLLEALSQTANPLQAFNRFDAFLGALPSGVQLFSLFHSNPALLDMVSEIMGNAPRLSEWLSRRPSLLDGVISDKQASEDIDGHTLEADLTSALTQAADFQDTLDIVIRWANDRRFQLGVELLQGKRTGQTLGQILSLVAETATGALTRSVEEEFSVRHGGWGGSDSPDRYGFAVLAFGKLGGMEIAPMSDLDLVFVYDTPPDQSESEGEKPLGPMVYFSRLGQRVVTAMTAQTGEGNLYEVDTRLRPNGRSGPVCTQYDGFRKYYDGEAWTWEHMALTRARPVYGPAGLCADLAETIEKALRQARDPAKLVVDIDDMRERIRSQHPGDNPWHIKYRRGGLLDIEFIAQYLQLRHASEGVDILSTNTREALSKLQAAGHLDEAVTHDLMKALATWQDLQAAIRLTAQDGFDEAAAPDGQKTLLQQVGGFETFGALRAYIDDIAETASGHYQTLIAVPAAARRPAVTAKDAPD